MGHDKAFLQKSLDKSGNFVYNNPYKERVVILGVDPALIVAAIRAGLFFWYYPQANYITSAFKNLQFIVCRVRDLSVLQRRTFFPVCGHHRAARAFLQARSGILRLARETPRADPPEHSHSTTDA